MQTITEPAQPGSRRSGAGGGDRYKWVALSNTTLSMSMATIDASIVIIAMPAIFRGIHLNPLAPGNIVFVLWMIMGYLLVQSVLVVTLGRLGDMHGRVRIYNLGFVVFTVASIILSLDPLTGAAWAQMAGRVDAEQARRGPAPVHRGKDHLGRLAGSGLFRHCEHLAAVGRDQGDADRLVAVALSAINHATDFLADGCTEDDLGLTALRAVAAERLPQPRTWWWTYQVYLAVR